MPDGISQIQQGLSDAGCSTFVDPFESVVCAHRLDYEVWRFFLDTWLAPRQRRDRGDWE